MSLRLERWLALAFFGLTVLFVGIVSVVFYAQLREAVLDRTQNQLLSINILKKQRIEQYLGTRREQTADSAVVRDLEEIATERTGMGATGESYLVDRQGRMITVSRFFPDTLSGSISVATEGFRRATAGQEGVGIYPDYRGVPVIGAYQKVEWPDNPWVLLTEIDLAEAMQPIVTLRNRFLWLSLVLLIVSGVVSVWLAKQLSRSIRALQRDITTLARGELPSPQSPVSRIEEIQNILASLRELIRALGQTARFARHIGEGKFDATYAPLSPQDELGRSLLTMRDQLLQLNAQKDQLERENKKLLVNTQEAERERIARDIHDGIGPLLTTTKLKVSSLTLPSLAKEDIIELLNSIITEIRRISGNLMPAVLSDFGPGEALNKLVREMARDTKITFRYVNDLLPESRLDKEVGIALYRIAQEAINNTLKHAEATEIVMSLTEFDDQVVFYYQDNGKGLSDNEENLLGKGLRNIRERIRILGGTLRIHSDPGIVIEAEIPIT